MMKRRSVNMNNRILFVEDDHSILEMVKDYLTKEGFQITTAMDGEEAVSTFLNHAFDLIILDIMLPKLDGLEVMKIIRERSTVPILIMSAKDSDLDQALGLGLGADDYLCKPFSMVQLVARIKAQIRRATKYSQHKESVVNIFSIRDLTIDFTNYQVKKHDRPIKLTSKEFEILKLFTTHPNRVYTKAQIYQSIWQDEYYGDENIINVHMRRLREKIEDDPSNPQYIKTLWGIGYKLEE